MSARRRLCAAARLIVALLSAASPGAQEPALDEVLGRTAPQRTLRSDLILVKPSDADRFVEMRESYVKYGERISGHAAYGKFRLLKQ